jgi:hypothetical protein
MIRYVVMFKNGTHKVFHIKSCAELYASLDNSEIIEIFVGDS